MYIIIIIIIIIIIKYKNLKEKQNSSYLSNDFRIKKKKKNQSCQLYYNFL